MHSMIDMLEPRPFCIENIFSASTNSFGAQDVVTCVHWQSNYQDLVYLWIVYIANLKRASRIHPHVSFSSRFTS